jgi:hypothetical protein
MLGLSRARTGGFEGLPGPHKTKKSKTTPCTVAKSLKLQYFVFYEKWFDPSGKTGA